MFYYYYAFCFFSLSYFNLKEKSLKPQYDVDIFFSALILIS